MSLTKVRGAVWDSEDNFLGVNVKDYGATGDGSTDDTAAIQSAIDAASALKARVLFPNGEYIVTGLTLGDASNNSCILEGLNYSIGPTGAAAKITLKAGSDTDLITVDGECHPANFIKNLVLNGNASNQSAGSGYVVNVEDAVVDGIYHSSVVIENCTLQYGASGGLYLGDQRGATRLVGTRISDNGTTSSHHGLHCNTYDVYMADCHLGRNTGYGIYLEYAGQFECFGTNIFYNEGGGIYTSDDIDWITFKDCSVDQNHHYGLYVTQDTGNPNTQRLFDGIRFVKNDAAITDTDAMVYVDQLINDPAKVVITNSHFIGDNVTSGTNCAYGVQFLNTSSSIIFSHNFVNSTGFSTALTNSPKSIINTEPEVSTWTPVIEGTSTAGAGTYTTQEGTYIKHGNVITANCKLVWTAHTGTGNMNIGGLPFTPTIAAAASVSTDNIAISANEVISARIEASQDVIYLRVVTGGTAGAAAAIPIDTAGSVWASVTYTI